MERLAKAWPVGLQLLGALGIVYGVYLLAGPAWSLILSGAMTLMLGTLKEGGYLDGSGETD